MRSMLVGNSGSREQGDPPLVPPERASYPLVPPAATQNPVPHSRSGLKPRILCGPGVDLGAGLPGSTSVGRGGALGAPSRGFESHLPDQPGSRWSWFSPRGPEYHLPPGRAVDQSAARAQLAPLRRTLQAEVFSTCSPHGQRSPHFRESPHACRELVLGSPLLASGYLPLHTG